MPIEDYSAAVSLLGAHGNVDAAVALGLELDLAFLDSEDGVVSADADAGARVPLRATLAAEDVAGDHMLAAVALDAEALRSVNRGRSWLSRRLSFVP